MASLRNTMPRTEQSPRRNRTAAPSPPFGHVSWREHGYHDADDDMAVLAEVVMGADGEAAKHVPDPPVYLRTFARYPLWVMGVRGLVGGAVSAVVLFLVGASRYHYVAVVDGRSQVDLSAVLSGLQFALLGWLAGLLAGALWGMLVFRYARRQVRVAYRRHVQG